MVDNNEMHDVTASNFKISEVVLSFLLVVAVSASFSFTHQYLSVNEDGSSVLSHLPRMRGVPREHIKMGVPDVWLKTFSAKLNEMGMTVKVSRIQNVWLIDASAGRKLSYEENKELKIFLQRYGVKSKNIEKLHITLSGFASGTLS